MVRPKKIYNWNDIPVIIPIDTVALLFGVSISTVKQWLYKGQIKGIKIGKLWFFDKGYIMALCEGKAV